MPFCTQCGGNVAPADRFCGNCGCVQQDNPGAPGAAPSPSKSEDFLSSVTPRTASTLCYIPFVGWIAAIVFLAAERFRHDSAVRFHAFQGLYLYVFYLFMDLFVIDNLENSFVPFAKLVRASLIGIFIFLMIKTGQGSPIRLPVLGDFADKSAAEQR